MNKKIESIQKSIDIFKEMIKENSPAEPFFLSYYELTPRGRYEREHDDSFKEIRETILNSLKNKYDEEYLEKKSSFIFFLSLGGKEIDNLDWRRLLDILKENKRNRGNYLKFLRDLERAGRSDIGKYYAAFTIKDLDRFLSDVIGEINDDDGTTDVPLIKEKQRNTIIENKEEDGDEEKDEIGESSEQGKLLERVNNLREIVTTLLKQIEEKRTLLKENSDQQENKKSEEEINELEKQLNYIIEKK